MGTERDFNSSARLDGAIVGSIAGDGSTSTNTAGNYGVNTGIQIRAQGRGRGNLMVKITGPGGFKKTFSLRMDPTIKRTVRIEFIPKDGVTTGDTVTLDTEDDLRVQIELDTAALTASYKLEASASGSVSDGFTVIEHKNAGGNTQLSADNLASSGQGHLDCTQTMDVTQV